MIAISEEQVLQLYARVGELEKENDALREQLDEQIAKPVRYLYEESAEELLEFGIGYDALGWSIQEQLRNVLDDKDANCNINAINLIKQNLGGFNREIDDAIDAWMKANG